jgi:hypothetical protein
MAMEAEATTAPDMALADTDINWHRFLFSFLFFSFLYFAPTLNFHFFT